MRVVVSEFGVLSVSAERSKEDDEKASFGKRMGAGGIDDVELGVAICD